jgi:hypothetical protein
MKPQLAIQPTFRLDVSAAKEVAVPRFQSAMERRGDGQLYMSHGEYAEFHLEPEMHRLWSPHLLVYFVDGNSDDRCSLIGRFAPRPNLWTLIWIFYLAFFCSIFFAGIFAGSQWLVGEFPWGLAIVAATLVLYAGLFIASQIGQSLCADQMDLLRGRLDKVLTDAGLVGTERRRETSSQAAGERVP